MKFLIPVAKCFLFSGLALALMQHAQQTKTRMSADDESDWSAQCENEDTNSLFKRSNQTASKPSTDVAGKCKKGGKTVEEIYQKKTQLEHILLRPDSYIGSIEPDTRSIWVLSEEETMVEREITFVPGLYKIFDEIVVNAADNKQRDASMKCIKVEIDDIEGTISVFNDGKGIPIQVHKQHGIYIPELIFGHLLTSSNYDDTQKKVTGGRNGFGAKLTNIFSKEFIVETADGTNRYTQKFTANMAEKHTPKITKCSEEWTKITFKPDLEKFGMDKLDSDILSLMKKRVYDLAGCTDKSVSVYLNGKKIAFKKFSDYVKMYLSKDDAVTIYEEPDDRWQVCVSISDGHFQQVSFANSISTWKGGSHVKHVTDSIVKKLGEEIQKKHKSSKLKPVHIKNHLWVFVNALIENPTFDSQTKENLTSRANTFGSKCELSPAFHKKVLKCGVVDNITSWAKFKEKKDLKKNDGKKKEKITGIPKLEDASKAGGKYASKCTLILTEGDSAKALAMSGIGVIGREYYGVFPLKGKLLNVRDCKTSQVTNNNEISYLKQILGLQNGKNYDNTNALRYGHVMIMTDQDHDGSHIKGLLINFFHTFWPSLLRIPGFLTQFITPIIRAKKGKRVTSFYTLHDYMEWKSSMSSKEAKTWHIKYYKGLGTSTSKEAKEYFGALDRHNIEFEWGGDSDLENSKIELVFSKKKADDRKHWLEAFEPGTFMDYSEFRSAVTYAEFIDNEFIHFSNADNVRSIPSLMDGLKPGQRKIIFGCFKKKVIKEIKVGQLSGIISQLAAYHHGEMSLTGTIVNLAQDFVGSNNINLLLPIGQFGTRHVGGKDCASARYIFTALNPLARLVFHPDDDHVLKYLDDDGTIVEPEWYAPIIPMVLVNGVDGIGTGWSTNIPNFNPMDLVKCLRMLILGEVDSWENLPDIMPWYAGFNGKIESCSKEQSFNVEGVLEIISENQLRITELPLRKTTESYKEFLDKLCEDEKSLISEYESYNTDVTIEFVISLSEGTTFDSMDYEDWLKYFKLTSTITLSNMVLFDKRGCLRKFASPQEIIGHFYDTRLEIYGQRKTWLHQELLVVVRRLQNKARFIQEVVDGTFVVSKRKKMEMLQDLVDRGYEAFSTKPVTEQNDGDSDAEVEALARSDYEDGYNYLLSMKLWSLTEERISALKLDCELKEKSLRELLALSPSDLWNRDLDLFVEAYEEHEAQRAKEIAVALGMRTTKGGKGAKKSRSAKIKMEYDALDSQQFHFTHKPEVTSTKLKSKSKRPKAGSIVDAFAKMNLKEEVTDTTTKPKRKVPVKKNKKKRISMDSEVSLDSDDSASALDSEIEKMFSPIIKKSGLGRSKAKKSYAISSDSEVEMEVDDRLDAIGLKESILNEVPGVESPPKKTESEPLSFFARIKARKAALENESSSKFSAAVNVPKPKAKTKAYKKVILLYISDMCC